ncbi:hypothetical protein scyTo_0020959 [Scyliorhinus torazame]|uniref:Uncharacterized protein n=1 Tax=Scyliorhinus torazame TaxID=75743 RepID=A0A401PS32_SCYTO|nr:hypothetical protein [Scyliorhinus torazame]
MTGFRSMQIFLPFTKPLCIISRAPPAAEFSFTSVTLQFGSGLNSQLAKELSWVGDWNLGKGKTLLTSRNKQGSE